MTREEANNTFGAVFVETEHYVLRAKPTPLKVEVSVHRKEDGREMLPESYVAGSNFLIWSKP
jgi:hypothetical protein